MADCKPKHRNDFGRWAFLALICAGGSTGGTMLRPQPPQTPHNPNITTEAWVKLLDDVEDLGKEMAVLSGEVRTLIRRVPQQP